MPFVSDLATALRDLDCRPFKSVKEHQKIPWPHINSKLEWPEADIYLVVNERIVCVVEVEDTTDPVRNVAKYWPLLHAMGHDTFSHPRMILVEVVIHNPSYGITYRRLANFVGKQLQAQFPGLLEFTLIYSENPNAHCIAQRIADIISETYLL